MSLDVMFLDGDPPKISQIYFDEDKKIRLYEKQDNKKTNNPVLEKVLTAIQSVLRDALPDNIEYKVSNGRAVFDSIRESSYRKLVIISEDMADYEVRVWEMILMFFSGVAVLVYPEDYSIGVILTENEEDRVVVEDHLNMFLKKEKTKKISRKISILMKEELLEVAGEWNKDAICEPKEVEQEPVIGRVVLVDFLKEKLILETDGGNKHIKFKAVHCSEILKMLKGCGQMLVKISVQGIEYSRIDTVKLHYLRFEDLS